MGGGVGVSAVLTLTPHHHSSHLLSHSRNCKLRGETVSCEWVMGEGVGGWGVSVYNKLSILLLWIHDMQQSLTQSRAWRLQTCSE